MDLLQELKARNISINECSKRTGIPYSALFSIVHKKVRLENCQYKTLKKLADFFSCSTDELFTDYTKISIFWKNEKTAEATIFENEVLIERFTLNPAKQIFAKEKISRFEFGEILQWRCWDQNRDNIEKYLFKLGLTDFNPYQICRKTHGVMYQDKIWFKFDGENISWEDVKCC